MAPRRPRLPGQAAARQVSTSEPDVRAGLNAPRCPPPEPAWRRLRAWAGAWWLAACLLALPQPGPAGETAEAPQGVGSLPATVPWVTWPRLTGAPVLDGQVDEPFWARAARIEGFLHYPGDRLAERQPVVWAAWTEAGLWLAAQVPLAPGNGPQAVLAAHDAPIYTEDTVEIFVQPEGLAAGDFHQFMVNAIGTRYDARTAAGRSDVGGYNPSWQAATATGPTAWTVEVWLPFAALGVSGPPAAGQVWRGNLCVDSAAGFSSALTWAPVADGFGDATRFGGWALGNDDRALRLEALSGCGAGQPVLDWALVGPLQPIVFLEADLVDSIGGPLFTYRLPLRDSRAAQMQLPRLTTPGSRLSLRGVDERGTTVLRQAFSLAAAPGLGLDIRTYPRAGHVRLGLDAGGLPTAARWVDCRLETPGQLPMTTRVQLGPDGRGAAVVPLASLAPGQYQETATAGHAAGALDSVARLFQVWPPPRGWDNTLGLDHSVPPPFTPVTSNRDGLAVWGREFVLAGNAFPQQIRSQGTDLLRRPPSLVLRQAGHRIELAQLPEQSREVGPDAVTLGAATALPGLQVQLRTTLEFDGFLSCDLTLTPTTGPVPLEGLELALELPTSVARFALTSNGSSASVRPVDEEVASAFLPYVWLGNDELGLAWAAGSDEHWTPAPRRALVMQPSPEGVWLRVGMVAAATELAAPATYRFALMPSPVRPIPRNDPFAYPAYSASGPVSFSEAVVYPLPDGVGLTAGTLEFWVRTVSRRPWGPTGLLRLGSATHGIEAALSTPARPQELQLTATGGGADAEPLLVGHVPAALDGFVHLALVWTDTTVAWYANGERLASAGSAAAAAVAAAVRDPGASLRLGCPSEYSGYTGIAIDDVRLSRRARYQGARVPVPAGPLAMDPDGVLLDPLDERFVPDGQDAHTTAGGVPTLGSQWDQGRFGGALRLEVAPPRPGLEVLHEMGVRVDTHWGWQDDMVRCYGQPVLFAEDKLVPGLRASLRGWHEQGIAILPYLAFPAISSTSGLIERYGDEWATEPRATLNWQFPGAPPGYHFLSCCQGARGYADYFAGGTVWAMDDLGFDGFYSDGLTSITACSNEGHGCGYRDAAGQLHPTWPLWATRETLKRMYRLVKARGDDKLVVNHCSFNLLLPLLSFSDIVYTGEHEDYENPLTARLRFASRPWGLYIVLLGSSEHVYSPLHAMAALLSGSSGWGSGIVGRNDFGRKDAAIRSAYRQFGTGTADWVPWWEAQACRAGDPGVRASYYVHPGQGVLLLAGNFNAADSAPPLHLDLGRCGLQGRPLRAWNALTGVDVPISEQGDLAPLIRGKSFVMLRLAPR